MEELPEAAQTLNRVRQLLEPFNLHACGLLMAGTDLQLDETSFLCGFSSLHYLLHISLCIHQHGWGLFGFSLYR